VQANISDVLSDKKSLDALKNLTVKRRQFLNDLKQTMFNWLEIMKRVTKEKQQVDEENSEECGLRNEMDYWK